MSVHRIVYSTFAKARGKAFSSLLSSSFTLEILSSSDEHPSYDCYHQLFLSQPKSKDDNWSCYITSS